MARLAPGGSNEASTPASTTTPKTPQASPNRARAPSALRIHTAPMAAPQIGAVAFRMESSDAETVCAA